MRTGIHPFLRKEGKRGVVGTLYLVGTPIGNLGDLSFRALETLKKVSRILTEDTRRAKILFQRYGIEKPCYSFYEHNESRRIPTVLSWLRKGEEVALISDGGLPLLSDPGYLLVKEVLKEKIPLQVVPGPSAVTTALLYSGFPPYPFAFFGFLPRGKRERREKIRKIIAWDKTIVLFLSPHRGVEELHDLAEEASQRKAVLLREMTKLHEDRQEGTLQELYERSRKEPWKGEWTLVVGPASFSEESSLPGVEGKKSEEGRKEELVSLLLSKGVSGRKVAEIVSEFLSLPFRKVYREIMERERKRTV